MGHFGTGRSNKIPCSQNKAIYHFHMDHNAPCFPPKILRNHAVFPIFPGYLSRSRRNRRHWLYKLVMKFSRHLNLAMLMWRKKISVANITWRENLVTHIVSTIKEYEFITDQNVFLLQKLLLLVYSGYRGQLTVNNSCTSIKCLGTLWELLCC